MNLKLFAFILLLVAGMSYRNISNAQCSTTSTPYAYVYGTYMSINAFSLAGVASNNNGSGSNGYNSFTTPVRTLTITNTYPFTASVGNTWYALAFAIWIDLNGNGVYESTEQVASIAGSYTSARSGNITIPATATPGLNRRMRVRCAYTYNSSMSGSDACTNYPLYGYGETEDYYVNLENPCYPPTITTQPQNTTTCEAQNTSLSLVASGNGNSYQWEMSTGGAFTPLANSATYSGVTTNQLSINNTPANLQASKIRCKTTSDCGVSGYSDTVTLTVTPLAKVAQQSMGDTICTTVDKTITFTPGGNVTDYQWQIGTLSNGFTDLQNTPPFDGVNTQYLQIHGTPDSLNGQSFRCVFNGVCNQATTQPISLYVIFPPYFVKHPDNDTVYENTPAMFTVDVQNNTSFIYQWQASSNGGQSFSNISNDALYANYNTQTLIVKNSIAKNDWMFRCIIRSDDRLCGKFFDTSDAGKIVIKYPTSVASTKGTQYITIAPNPVSDNTLRIQANDELQNKTVQTIITDRLGRTVINTNLSFNNNAGNIDISNLAPGIYYIKMQSEGELLEGNYSFVKQ